MALFLPPTSLLVASRNVADDSPSGGIDCPIGWSKHRSASACIPPQEVCEADCGEGEGRRTFVADGMCH